MRRLDHAALSISPSCTPMHNVQLNMLISLHTKDVAQEDIQTVFLCTPLEAYGSRNTLHSACLMMG